MAQPAEPSRRRKSRGLSGVRPAYADVSHALVHALAGAGITHAFGLIGGAIAPFSRAVSDGPLELVHCRHETGAAFAALEAYFATGRPGLVFTTTGPGVTNALTGVAAARWDGGKLVLVSAATAPENRGRWGFQETEAWGMLPGPYPGAPLFHYSAVIDEPAALPVVESRLLGGLRRPGPFVAHIQLPLSTQTRSVPEHRLREVDRGGHPIASPARLEQVLERLRGSSFVLWVGFGARDSAGSVLRFAEETGAPVMCSARAKGVFPEDHPQYLGVTGFAGHASVRDYLRDYRPEYTLVIGSRLGEMTSLWSPDMLPRKGLVHVDVDADVFGAAYPEAGTLGIVGDAGAFLDGLLDLAGGTLRSKAPLARVHPFPGAPPPRSQGPVRPQVLMRALQRHALAGHDTLVLSEAGNAFAWATHWLRFSGRSRYRTSFGFGSMGHAATGVVGAALVSGRKAVAVVGDGTMMMNNEISTAVQHRARAIWVVLNDSQYGMIHQGMESIGYRPFATAIPPARFAPIAEALGATGITVRSEPDLDAALQAAMSARGPVVLDVVIDPREQAPTRSRNASLMRQGINGSERGEP